MVAARHPLHRAPHRRPRTKGHRPPGSPHGPKSLWTYWSNPRRHAVKQQNPGISNGGISRILSAEYRRLTEQDKAPYKLMAAQDQRRYKREMAWFNQQTGNEATEHDIMSREQIRPAEPVPVADLVNEVAVDSMMGLVELLEPVPAADLFNEEAWNVSRREELREEPVAAVAFEAWNEVAELPVEPIPFDNGHETEIFPLHYNGDDELYDFLLEDDGEMILQDDEQEFGQVFEALSHGMSHNRNTFT